jgi:hypothetical protein
MPVQRERCGGVTRPCDFHTDLQREQVEVDRDAQRALLAGGYLQHSSHATVTEAVIFMVKSAPVARA